MTRKCTKCKIYGNNKKRSQSRYCAGCVNNKWVRMFRFRQNRTKYTFQNWIKFYSLAQIRKKVEGRKQNAV